MYRSLLQYGTAHRAPTVALSHFRTKPFAAFLVALFRSERPREKKPVDFLAVKLAPLLPLSPDDTEPEAATSAMIALCSCCLSPLS